MSYTKKNPSLSNQYTDTTLFQAFDNGIDDADERLAALEDVDPVGSLITDSNPTSDQYRYLITLPISSSSTRDKLIIELEGIGYDANNLAYDVIRLSNRAGFGYRYAQGGPSTDRANFRVVAYSQVSGSVDVYLRTVTGSFISCIVRASQWDNPVGTQGYVEPGAPSTTVPSGTIVFDSGSASFSPNDTPYFGRITQLGWYVQKQGRATRSDANYTMSWFDAPTQLYNSALTANRTLTLPAAHANIAEGERILVVKQSGATGAFTLTVQTPTPTALHTFSSGATNVWAEFECDASTNWYKIRSGTV